MGISELYRISGVPQTPGVDSPSKPGSPGESEFKALLDQELKLSQHAETRIRSRSIPWSQEIEQRIKDGIEAASAKGSKEALILVDDVAVIANVKSKTVITAMDRNQMKEKIFTNIDSTVLA